MKKSLAVAALIAGLALTGCAAQPQAPVAPSMASAEPTSTAPNGSAYAEDDVASFLSMVKNNWRADEVPADEELVGAGELVCEELGPNRGFDNDLIAEWNDEENLVIHAAAVEFFCPAES